MRTSSAVGLRDIEELATECRNIEARRYIEEAIRCYQAGAYRACIITTWVAVVLDIVGKLRDLDLSGHADAHARLADFDAAHAHGEKTSDWKVSLKFEAEILKIARDQFEFISASEHDDLERLRLDRHRCAHPSMNSDPDPTFASAELARYHLRNSVSYLLSHPPVQGQAAFDQVWRDIKSSFFPEDLESARERLSFGPLMRARSHLVNRTVKELAKALLLNGQRNAERRRLQSALAATLELHREVATIALGESLRRTVPQVEDDDWARVIWLVRAVPVAWEIMDPSQRSTARQFIAKATGKNLGFAIPAALEIPGLEATALSRIDEIDDAAFAALVEESPSEKLVQNAIARFANAKSFRSAEFLGEAIITPLLHYFVADDVVRVLQAYQSNMQIQWAFEIPGILATVFDSTTELLPGTGTEWESVARVMEDGDSSDAKAVLIQKLRTATT